MPYCTPGATRHHARNQAVFLERLESVGADQINAPGAEPGGLTAHAVEVEVGAVEHTRAEGLVQAPLAVGGLGP